MWNCRTAISTSLLALAFGSAAHAQKFAYIDMQQAVLATTEGKKASAAINDKFAPKKAELDQLAKDIQAKQDAFSKNRATMSPSALTAAQTEIQTLTTNLQRKKEDAQQDLNDEENKQLGQIVPKLQQLINQYAAANQITIVVDTSVSPNNLIYGDKSLNIIVPIVTAYEKAGGGAAAPATGSAPPAPTGTPKPTAPAK
jgi:outer membrane protein